MALRIRVTVKPQAKRQEVKRNADGEYLVSVHAPAREGRANKALIELLANHLSVSKSSVRIVRGQSSRRKLVEVG